MLLMLFPWGNLNLIFYSDNLYLIFLVDMMKLIIAIALFIVPGVLLYLFLQLGLGDDPVFVGSIGFLPVGFALSVTIIALIGLAGRLLGFSFIIVKILYVIVGLILWLAVYVFGKYHTPHMWELKRIFGDILGNFPLVSALVISVLMMFNGHLFFIDDFTYLAYLTNWQHSPRLNFNNIIHQIDVLEIERFWLALYPMGQALISDLSGVPGILLFSNYLEPLLAVIAVIACYWFGRVLGFSKRAAGFAVLIQVSLYTWMMGEQWPVGFWYFFNLAEDKVSAVFLLSPVFFVFVLNLTQSPSLKNFLLALFSGIGLTLTHPVILFFACLISAGLGLFALLVRKAGWRGFISMALVLTILVMPYVVIRFYNYSASAGFTANAKSVASSYEVEKYTRVVNDIFYGLNPEVLKFFDLPPEIDGGNIFQIFRTFPFVLTSLAGVWSLLNLKRGQLSWYVAVCVLLIAFATIPYTGWILGFFSNARLISRAAWFSPLGFAGVLLLLEIIDWFKTSRLTSGFYRGFSKKLPGGGYVILSLLLFFSAPMILLSSLPRIPHYFQSLDRARQLATVGDYIDQNSNPPVTSIAIDYMDIQMLPGVSAHTSIISYREEKDDNGHNFFMSPDEIHHRMYASNTIRSLEGTIPCEERRSLMEEFDVRYVVSPMNKVNTFIRIIENCGMPIELKYQTRDFVLLKVR